MRISNNSLLLLLFCLKSIQSPWVFKPELSHLRRRSRSKHGTCFAHIRAHIDHRKFRRPLHWKLVAAKWQFQHLTHVFNYLLFRLVSWFFLLNIRFPLTVPIPIPEAADTDWLEAIRVLAGLKSLNGNSRIYGGLKKKQTHKEDEQA